MSLYCGISDGETACYVLAGSESRSLGVSVSEILQDCHSERSSLSRTESDPSADLALPGEPLTRTRYPTTLTPPSKSLRLPKFINSSFESVSGRESVFYVLINPCYVDFENMQIYRAKLEQANFSACLAELILRCVNLSLFVIVDAFLRNSSII